MPKKIGLCQKQGGFCLLAYVHLLSKQCFSIISNLILLILFLWYYYHYYKIYYKIKKVAETQ